MGGSRAEKIADRLQNWLVVKSSDGSLHRRAQLAGVLSASRLLLKHKLVPGNTDTAAK